MNTDTIKQGKANWESLQAFVLAEESENPTLKRKNERYRSSLAKRQKRETMRILAKPGTKAYKDFMATPV